MMGILETHTLLCVTLDILKLDTSEDSVTEMKKSFACDAVKTASSTNCVISWLVWSYPPLAAGRMRELKRSEPAQGGNTAGKSSRVKTVVG